MASRRFGFRVVGRRLSRLLGAHYICAMGPTALKVWKLVAACAICLAVIAGLVLLVRRLFQGAQ